MLVFGAIDWRAMRTGHSQSPGAVLPSRRLPSPSVGLALKSIIGLFDSRHSEFRRTEDVTSENSVSPAGVPVFSYAGAPSGQEYEAWREEFCRRFCQLDAEPGAAERIECTVEVTRVGSLSFGAAHGTAVSFLRT